MANENDYKIYKIYIYIYYYDFHANLMNLKMEIHDHDALCLYTSTRGCGRRLENGIFLKYQNVKKVFLCTF